MKVFNGMLRSVNLPVMTVGPRPISRGQRRWDLVISVSEATGEVFDVICRSGLNRLAETEHGAARMSQDPIDGAVAGEILQGGSLGGSENNQAGLQLC